MKRINEHSTFEDAERGNELFKEAWTLLVKVEDILSRIKFSNDDTVTTVYECQIQEISKSLISIKTELELWHTSEEEFNEIKAEAVRRAESEKEFAELCDSMEEEDN